MLDERNSITVKKHTVRRKDHLLLSILSSVEEAVMGSSTKTFTFEEVAKHNHKKDCWIIIKGKAYDVTPFLDDHPGGDEVLVTATEKDATTDFEDIGHSDAAVEMMQTYFVGNVDTTSLPAAQVPNETLRPPAQAPAYNNQSSGFVKILQYLVPLLILGFAFALQYYGKKTKSTESEN
ncbi:cytochrome-b5 reductase [Vigna unguiculata]|uniref:Cytochrome-b5 reductase n=1 Tax=Vigna unguiculata TaxID=3917 RepID=A0A4D6MRM0_VIGUN|nr:cytochrome-b5 reductase [Vigna unguiculata]